MMAQVAWMAASGYLPRSCSRKFFRSTAPNWLALETRLVALPGPSLPISMDDPSDPSITKVWFASNCGNKYHNCKRSIHLFSFVFLLSWRTRSSREAYLKWREVATSISLLVLASSGDNSTVVLAIVAAESSLQCTCVPVHIVLLAL
jgi:hypothetical protein